MFFGASRPLGRLLQRVAKRLDLAVAGRRVLTRRTKSLVHLTLALRRRVGLLLACVALRVALLLDLRDLAHQVLHALGDARPHLLVLLTQRVDLALKLRDPTLELLHPSLSLRRAADRVTECRLLIRECGKIGLNRRSLLIDRLAGAGDLVAGRVELRPRAVEFLAPRFELRPRAVEFGRPGIERLGLLAQAGLDHNLLSMETLELVEPRLEPTQQVEDVITLPRSSTLLMLGRMPTGLTAWLVTVGRVVVGWIVYGFVRHGTLGPGWLSPHAGAIGPEHRRIHPSLPTFSIRLDRPFQTLRGCPRSGDIVPDRPLEDSHSADPPIRIRGSRRSLAKPSDNSLLDCHRDEYTA